MSGWFLLRNGIQQGPLTDDQVRDIVTSHQYDSTDRVRGPGYPVWVPLSAVAGIIGMQRSPQHKPAIVNPFDNPTPRAGTFNPLGTTRPGQVSAPRVPTASGTKISAPPATGVHPPVYILPAGASTTETQAGQRMSSSRRSKQLILAATVWAGSIMSLLVLLIWLAREPRFKEPPSVAQAPSASEVQPQLGAEPGIEANDLVQVPSASEVQPQQQPAAVPEFPTLPSQPAMTGQQIFQRAITACPLIMHQNSTGSGALVRSGGDLYLVTNRHVVLGGEEFSAVFFRYADGDVVPLCVYQCDMSTLIVSREADVAAFKVESLPAQLRAAAVPVELTTRSPQIGEPVYVIGYPGIGETGIQVPTFTEGSVATAVLPIPDKGLLFQITATINPGNSGGPVLSRECELLGLATFGVRNVNTQNFAVAAQNISKLLTDRSSQLTDREIAALWQEEQMRRAAALDELKAALSFEKFKNDVNYFRDLCGAEGYQLLFEFPLLIPPRGIIGRPLVALPYAEYRVVCLSVGTDIRRIFLDGRITVLTNPFLPPQLGRVTTQLFKDTNARWLNALTGLPPGFPSQLIWVVKNQSNEDAGLFMMIFAR